MILPKTDPYLDSQRIAVRLGRLAPMHFCTFGVTAEGRKTPFKKSGMGVARDTPHEQLYTSDDIEFLDEPPHGQYIGLVMQSPIPVGDKLLICIDVDMKHSTSPTSTAIQRMARWAKENNALVETSVSTKGKHIFILADQQDLDKVLPKYKLGGGQEVEIFGHAKAAGKSVLLSGLKVQGTIETTKTYNLHQLLTDWGVIEQHMANQPAPVTTHATKPFDFTALVPDDEFAKASAALQHIDPDITYDEWIAIGQALHTAFGHQGHHLWAQWSSTGSKYAGEKDIDSHWKSFSADKGVSIGTLFHIAKQHGYTPPTTKTERKSAIEDFNSFIQKAAPAPTPEPTQPEAIPDASIWQEVDLDLNTLHPIDYLIDNFLAHSLMVVAGQPGVGKTTAMLSLAMVISGFTLKDCSLSTEAPRRVIYVTEDVSQVQLSLFSYARHHHLDPNKIREMIHVVEARRSEMPDILLLTQNILKHTTTHEGHTLRPYLILDTASATFDIEDENNNSEVAIYMEGIKQTLYTKLNTPIAIVTHTAKSLSTSDDTATARGASAWTGNATLTATLFIDQEERFMTLVKKRYQPLITELKFKTHVNNEVTVSRYGKPQDVVCITVTPTESSKQDRQQSAEEEKNEKQNQRAMDKADEACAYVQSILNAHPEGVIIRRGSTASRTIPSDWKTCHQLHWDDVFNHVPGSSRGDVKRAVGTAVFSRFAPDAPASGWVKLG